MGGMATQRTWRNQLNMELAYLPKIDQRSKWLVTGAAGFIGSNLVEALLQLDQTVVGLDNFSTGHQSNLDEVQATVGASKWSNFNFIHGDIRDLEVCNQACQGAKYVLHQAALGSVPRSIVDPISTHASNLSGFLNMLVAARDSQTSSFVYAASSSTYGDHPTLPKREDTIGRPLSPYALTKFVNELYADVFARVYNFNSIGLRYFNVFGPRQDPNGAYAAVIPKWFEALKTGDEVFINGTGETSRDFCFVENAVQANLRAALSESPAAQNQVYNVAFGQSTSLKELFDYVRDCLVSCAIAVKQQTPSYRDFRNGDILHSLADIEKAKTLLGYNPHYSLRDGLVKAAKWYTK